MTPSNASRRAFLARAGALSMAGAASPLALNLAALAEAAAATAADYKALVCVFLYGGNDYANTLVPYDAASYAQHQALRPTLAYARDALTATALNPVAAPVDRNGVARQYALAPELAPLLPHFDAGRLAVMLNVGTLIEPTTKAQYTARTVQLPPKLFSHNDQQSIWQSSLPEGATSGWGGRIGDLFAAGNGNATFTCVNVSGNAVFMSGKTAVQYQVAPTGPVKLTAASSLFGSAAGATALHTLVTQSRTHLFEAEHTRTMARALTANDALTAALLTAPVLTTPYPAGNPLADQLNLVARMIGNATTLGAKRQVFFVSLGGFDTHDGLVANHPGLLTTVADAMAAFQASLAELNVAPQVTTFTASDFGRTLVGNNDGSDHGWGSMHLVLGGAVNGRRFYGQPPLVASNGADDVGQGRLLPTTSVDQLAATLARWFGVSATDQLTVVPNLVHWDVAQRDLAFV